MFFEAKQTVNATDANIFITMLRVKIFWSLSPNQAHVPTGN